MIRLFYIFKLIARGLRLRPAGSALTLVACWFAMSQLSLAFTVVDIADRLSTMPATSGSMVAYVKEGTPRENVAALGNTLRSRPEVARALFIPRDKGLEKMRKWLGASNPLVEDVDPAILPDAFEITLNREHAHDAPRLAREIAGIDGVSDVRYRTGLIGSIAGSFTRIVIGACAFGAVVVICLMLVIYLSIRVGIVSRKQEIEVMKMLGATVAFRYSPYLIEAAAYGLAGSAAALFTTSAALGHLSGYSAALQTVIRPIGLNHAASVVFFSCFCSMAGALLAVRKSIDV
ncbi:MAG TPA: permease-like cell division protein FtsX [Deltaproteobacteria bacterium]|nr:permease-like cell division protein FtsX [Deltaproteobacteria bacterium]